MAISSSRAKAKNKVFFTDTLSRAAVEGPGLNKGQVKMAAFDIDSEKDLPLFDRAISGHPVRLIEIYCRFLHDAGKHPCPSTSARVHLEKKEIFRLASAQDDSLWKRS